MKRWKTVIHVHTDYSFDSNVSPADLIDTARAQGVDCVAVTDHDEIDGAFAAREIGRTAGVNVVVGEEISSADGHIIGLFLNEHIPPRLSGEETIRRIKEQGGLVLVPHPFALLCEEAMSRRAADRLAPLMDAVEICNAQNPLVWENWAAARFAHRHGLPTYVGADSHIRGFLDGCYQTMPAFDRPTEFLRSLANATLTPGRFGLSYYPPMMLRHCWDLVATQRLSGFGTNAPLQPQAQRSRAAS